MIDIDPMKEKKLFVSTAPHIHSGDSVEKKMYGTLLALVPAAVVAVLFFGTGAVAVMAVSVAVCTGVEFVITRWLLKGKPTVGDGSAILTGVLLAFNLPSSLPLGLVVLGAVVAIGVGKMSFGGLGNNVFNPALVGRVFLLISFPTQMTSWPEPEWLPLAYPDGTSAATVLGMLKGGFGEWPSYGEMLLGKVGGSLGEVGAGALLLGGGFLLWKRIISWHIPVAVLGTVALLTGVLHGVSPERFAPPAIHLLSGGLLLGAIFMATDYVTSPLTHRGMLLFGVGIGAITVVIRQFGAYPEGVSFAILIMNAFTPLINSYVKPRRFGRRGE